MKLIAILLPLAAALAASCGSDGGSQCDLKGCSPTILIQYSREIPGAYSVAVTLGAGKTLTAMCPRNASGEAIANGVDEIACSSRSLTIQGPGAKGTDAAALDIMIQPEGGASKTGQVSVKKRSESACDNECPRREGGLQL